MEFSDLGGICELCKRQDYLPIKCIFCKKIFCKEHSSIDSHNCQNIKNAQEKNKKSTSIYKESCSFKGCKKKEIIKFECKECKLNFCINHRLSFDHNCKTNNCKTNNCKTNNYKTNNLNQKNINSKLISKKKKQNNCCIIL